MYESMRAEANFSIHLQFVILPLEGAKPHMCHNMWLNRMGNLYLGGGVFYVDESVNRK